MSPTEAKTWLFESQLAFLYIPLILSRNFPTSSTWILPRLPWQIVRILISPTFVHLLLHSTDYLSTCVSTSSGLQFWYSSATNSSMQMQMQPVTTPMGPYRQCPILHAPQHVVWTAPVVRLETHVQLMATVPVRLDTCIEAGVRTAAGNRRTAVQNVKTPLLIALVICILVL